MEWRINPDPMCPLHREGKCEEIKRLHKRIAELESKLVCVEVYDNQICECRTFNIKFNKLLNPEEAMDIFVRNIEKIIKKQEEP